MSIPDLPLPLNLKDVVDGLRELGDRLGPQGARLSEVVMDYQKECVRTAFTVTPKSGRLRNKRISVPANLNFRFESVIRDKFDHDNTRPPLKGESFLIDPRGAAECTITLYRPLFRDQIHQLVKSDDPAPTVVPSTTYTRTVSVSLYAGAGKEIPIEILGYQHRIEYEEGYISTAVRQKLEECVESQPPYSRPWTTKYDPEESDISLPWELPVTLEPCDLPNTDHWWKGSLTDCLVLENPLKLADIEFDEWVCNVPRGFDLVSQFPLSSLEGRVTADATLDKMKLWEGIDRWAEQNRAS